MSTTVPAAIGAADVRPSRRLIAAGVKRGTGPLAVQVMSDADRAAHAAASFVRPAGIARLHNRAPANDACPLCGFWSCRCGRTVVAR